MSDLSEEREEGLLEVYLYGQGWCEGLYKCEGLFDKNYKYRDDFVPEKDGWYYIGEYDITDLIHLKSKYSNLKFTFKEDYKDVEVLFYQGISVGITPEILATTETLRELAAHESKTLEECAEALREEYPKALKLVR